MNRRAFIALAGGAFMWPLTARSEGAPKVYRIFWLSTGSEPDPLLDGFREGMRSFGYVEGKNLAFERHYAAGDPAVLRRMAAELNRENVDLAVSAGSATRVMKSVTDVPVLFALSGDPVELGVVKSLAQPGGNFTGSTFLSLELAGKRVEQLKEVFPGLRTLAVLSNTDHPGEQSEWRATQRAAETLKIRPAYIPFNGACELDQALQSVSQAQADALLVFPEPATLSRRAYLAEFAISQRLPTMFGLSEYCDAGGLMSYGANQRATYVGLANYADRILRGEKPSNLPVEQPTKFELVLNLKTAKALGVEEAMNPILFRARVIE
jgi:putative tryptophan/tyrosine transport system substrate-binding protein